MCVAGQGTGWGQGWPSWITELCLGRWFQKRHKPAPQSEKLFQAIPTWLSTKPGFLCWGREVGGVFFFFVLYNSTFVKEKITFNYPLQGGLSVKSGEQGSSLRPVAWRAPKLKVFISFSGPQAAETESHGGALGGSSSASRTPVTPLFLGLTSLDSLIHLVWGSQSQAGTCGERGWEFRARELVVLPRTQGNIETFEPSGWCQP